LTEGSSKEIVSGDSEQLPIPEEDEKKPDDDEALTGPEQKRPFDDVHARFCDLAFQSRKSSGHLLPECLDLFARGDIRPESGDLLPYGAGLLCEPELDAVIGHD
jgi:hypothetical protein